MRRCASAYDAVTDVIAPPCSRAAASASAEQLDLAGLLDGLRRDRRRRGARRGGRWRRERDRAHAAATAARGGRGRVARGEQALGREVGGVREAGGVAAHDAQAGAAIAARHELLDAAVVEAGARRAPILHEHLGEVAAAAQRALER